jgi:uncharacterized protein
MSLTIVPLHAGLLALIFLGLSLRVVYLRRTLRVGLGSGGHESLNRAVRAHGNFAEYVPLALVLLLGLEAGTALPAWALHTMGLALVLGRVLHGFFGLNRHAGASLGRVWGTALTWLVIGVSALLLVATGVGRWLV